MIERPARRMKAATATGRPPKTKTFNPRQNGE
jgi:hypothetical protein